MSIFLCLMSCPEKCMLDIQSACRGRTTRRSRAAPCNAKKMARGAFTMRRIRSEAACDRSSSLTRVHSVKAHNCITIERLTTCGFTQRPSSSPSVSIDLLHLQHRWVVLILSRGIGHLYVRARRIDTDRLYVKEYIWYNAGAIHSPLGSLNCTNTGSQFDTTFFN